MSKVVNIWEAKHKKDGSKNLEEFIRFAKEELTLYKEQGWDADKWKPNKGQTLIFGFQENSYAPVEKFKEPFMGFAKGFIRQQLTITEIASADLWIAILRYIYRTLQEESSNTPPCILNLSGRTINAIIGMIKTDNLSLGRRYQLGGKLSKLVLWLRKNKIILTLPVFKNPFSRPVDKTEQLNKDGAKWREERCPSMHQMLCLAECFAKAKDVVDRYYTSVLVLLCFAPGRVNELNGLTIHSLQQDDDGTWYVVWFGSKDFPPHRKPIPDLMLEVVKEAFSRLIEIGKPARVAAKWAFDNPERFYRHKQCITEEFHGENELLSEREFAYAMQVTGCLHRTNKEKISTQVKWINEFLSNGDLTYHRLNNLIHERYKDKTFPNNPKSERPVWENLLLIRDKETHQQFEAKIFSWIMPTANMINSQISHIPKGKRSLLWERFGLVDEDGAPLKMTTHQLRVWLNTHAKIGGVDDWKIAQWSGRADVRHNSAYDLRTSEEKQLIKKQLLVSNYEDLPDPIVLRKANLPVPLRSIGIDRDGVADFTGLGFCTHEFAQTPCTKSGECITCKEHVCLTGIPETLEELFELDKLLSEQFKKSKQAADDDTFGADRWVTHLGWKLSHVRAIIEKMNDESLPVGTVIRIPTDHDPSPTRRAIELKSLETEVETKATAKPKPKLNMKNLLGIDDA